MSNYILKFKGKYRLLPDIELRTNDFIKDENGNISEDHVYIDCKHGCNIRTYGHINGSKAVYLTAYIPSLYRGRKIKKTMDEQGIEYVQYIEGDEEVEFKFKALDIEKVADLMNAKTSGANISPFSTRNLPRANIKIPTEENDRYKIVIADVQKTDLLLIHRITDAFLVNILNKKLRKTDKTFQFSSDMRKLKMSRMAKEYIWSKGLFNEYLIYLKKEINKFYNKQG